MTPDRWERIKQVMEEALARPSAERPRLIASLCPGDEALAVGVESLLAAHIGAGRFMETPALEHPAWAAAFEDSTGARVSIDRSTTRQSATRSRRWVTSPALALDDALTSLAQVDPRGARVVELRFFSGLTIEETAEALDVSPGTVKRDWNTARAWLYREMR